MKISVQDAFGSELATIWAPKGSQMERQKGPKMHQKRDQNDIEFLVRFLDRFWTAQGPTAPIENGDLRNARGRDRLF